MPLPSLRTFPARAARALRPAAPWVALAVALALLALALTLDMVSRGEVGADFRSFYLAGRAARVRADLYDVATLTRLGASQKLGRPYPYLYPPFFAYAMTPLAALPAAAAAALWSVTGACVLGAGLAVHVRTLHRAHEAPGAAGGGTRGAAELATLAALLLALLPLRDNIAMGQVNLVVLGAVLLALGALAAKRDMLAGTALAVAALIKVTPAIFLLLFLARRRYRAAAAFCGAMAGLAAATLALGALPAWARYRALLPSLQPGETVPGLFPPGVTFNFGWVGAFSRVVPGHPLVVRALTLTAMTLMLAPLLLRARRAVTEVDAQRALAPLFVVMVVSSPLVYAHHMIYLLPAVLLAVWSALRGGRYVLLAATLLAAPLAGIDTSPLYARFQLPDLALRVASSVNLCALLVLYGACLAVTRVRVPKGGGRRAAGRDRGGPASHGALRRSCCRRCRRRHPCAPDGSLRRLGRLSADILC